MREFFSVFAVLLALIDLIKDLQDFPDLPFGNIVEIVLLNVPHANYEILPLIIILSSVALFLRLARSSEVVVVRASGRSAMRTLIAPVAVASLIGLIGVTLSTPSLPPRPSGTTIWSVPRWAMAA
ncbi:MAG: LptF/LptG family permease [Roseovarius pacificus]|nr:LptF/LptG family permease [Roseovarius pacificus]